MKNISKYTVLPRLLALLFAFVLLLTAAALPAMAAQDSEFTQWTYVRTTDTLVASFPDGDELIYTRYEYGYRFRYEENDCFMYENSVIVDGNGFSIYSESYKGDTLILENDDGFLVYATEEGKKELDELFASYEASEIALHVYKDGTLYTKALDEGFHSALLSIRLTPSNTDTVTDTLHGLRYAPRVELWTADEDSLASANMGYLFNLAEEFYYLDIRDIPASAIGKDGSITPSASVTVTLYRLPDSMQEDASAAFHRCHGKYGYTEMERYSAGVDIYADTSDALVYFTIALLGILLPIAPIVMGLCLPHSRKQGYKKRWYLLTLLGGIWMLLGILVLVLMIIAL